MAKFIKDLTYNLDFTSTYSWKLFLIHLTAYISLPVFITQATTPQLITALLIGYVYSTITILYFHRFLAHSLFKFKHPWIEYIFLTISTLSTNSPGVIFTSIHYDHHKYSDREGDPHLCNNLAHFLRIHFLFYWVVPSNISNVRKLLKIPAHRFVLNHYFKIQLVYILLLLLTVGPMWALAMYFIPGMISFNVLNSSNSLSHLFGYRTFNTNDKSTNNLLVGYASGGEWHHNHHANAHLCRFGIKWWEFDPSWYIIKVVGKNITNKL